MCARIVEKHMQIRHHLKFTLDSTIQESGRINAQLAVKILHPNTFGINIKKYTLRLSCTVANTVVRDLRRKLL